MNKSIGTMINLSCRLGWGENFLGKSLDRLTQPNLPYLF